MKTIVLSILFFIFNLNSHAKEVIVQLNSTMNQSEVLSTLNLKGLKLKEVLLEELGLMLFETTDLALESVQELKQLSEVENVLKNEVMQLRETPNDPQFKKLWSLKNSTLSGADIKATKAWEVHRGGSNINKDWPVVAIVDGGFDLEHKDLKANFWVNKKEIPNNKKDDDGNGYIDDVYGWNAYNNSGSITSHAHGTHVAGIIGAVGDNKNQVVGVNWETQMMLLQGSSGRASVVLKAYNYILKQKKLWIESNGKKGANIVATNNSFGVDRANCQKGDYKLWNDVYEKLGEVGILSVAATANRGYNVDEIGDVPTGCMTDFIIGVTNTTNKDVKYSNAAWGVKNIDLGAPGTSILSTIPGQGTGLKTGTSMATPHVAGAIALMHSSASRKFVDAYNKNPAKMALKIKSILLKTVDPLNSLEGKTVSGGRLNLLKAVKEMSNFE